MLGCLQDWREDRLEFGMIHCRWRKGMSLALGPVAAWKPTRNLALHRRERCKHPLVRVLRSLEGQPGGSWD